MRPSARSRRADDLERWLATAPPKGHGAAEVLLRDGPAPGVITAVHAVRHWRNGAWKVPDRFTGPLALEAARLAGARAVVVVAPSHADANHDEAPVVKRWIEQLVGGRPDSFVLDVHGMRSGDADVVVGTSGLRTPAWLLDRVLAEARDAGLTVRVAHEGPLSASGSHTVTSWAIASLMQPAVQLELAPRLRDPHGRPADFDLAAGFLAAVAG